ncbi:MAG: hypothetical protein JWQ29_749 [Phenylobacterium sp.]|nr:hypothetical protein [Phenylobacterium sp.]
MRPIGLGLVAALLVAVLAPVAVMSAPKAPPPAVSEAQRKAGMAEAPPLAAAANLPCQVSDARFVGKSPEDKKKGTPAQSYYEVACGQGAMGYVIQATVGATPTAFTCVEANTPPEAGKPAALPCLLPGNADPKAALAAALVKEHVQCVPEAVRGIGQSKTATYMEIACQGGVGYVVVGSAPFDGSKKLEAQNCLNFDAASGGNIKCTLGDPAARLAIVDRYAAEAKNNCVVKDRRFVGTATDGSNFFEASCQDGKGYIYKIGSAGQFTQAYECAKAQGVLGGCQLTDAREAATEQASLYTRLAKAAGSNCQVEKYAIFPAGAGEDVVELVCTGGPGAVGIFKANAKGEVLDCGHALVAGYRCGLNKPTYETLTADLKKFQPTTTCVVSESRLAAKTAKGTLLLEVACADKFKGYMIEYSTGPVTAVNATGCAFAGGCKLPGNT